MPTQSQVMETLLTAQLKCADLTNNNRLNSASGVGKVAWSFIRKMGLFISAVDNQYQLGDYTSAGFLSVYDCLCKLTGAYGAGPIDPNAHSDDIIIDVIVPGFEPTIVTLSETNLLFDVPTQQWYLPWSNSAIPVSVVDNGVSFTFNYAVVDQNNVPYEVPRIFGFANGDSPQVIIVTAI